MKETPTLQTARLLLRPARIEDADAVYVWTSSDRVNESLFSPPNRDLEVTRKLLADWIRRRRNYSWFLVLDGTTIGECQVIKDVEGGGFEVGMTLWEESWGKGYMREALSEVIRFLFSLGYSFGQAKTDVRNLAARKTLESVGFLLAEGPEPYRIEKKGKDIEVVTYRLDK